jgi:hypothetical protein
VFEQSFSKMSLILRLLDSDNDDEFMVRGEGHRGLIYPFYLLLLNGICHPCLYTGLSILSLRLGRCRNSDISSHRRKYMAKFRVKSR